MGGWEPEPVERDSRGILDPWLLRERIRLTRYPPTPTLAGLVDRFWAVEWDLPAGGRHRQQVLTHPGANLSVGHADALAPTAGQLEACCYGVSRSLSVRTLTGRGWTVAAMTTPGGLGALLADAAVRWTDQVAPIGRALRVDEPKLIMEVCAASDQPARVAALRQALETVIADTDPDRVRQAREVAGLARLAETDRTLRRLQDLSVGSGFGPRTLQRMFREYAGVSPTWVLRRYRLLDAAEAVRDGAQVSWAALAADLGYADQAHLTRDFQAAIGRTPAAYAAAQSPR